MNFGGGIDVDSELAAREDHLAPKRHVLRAILYPCLTLVDILALLLAFELGSFARYGELGLHSAMDVLVVTLPIYIGTAFNTGAYGFEVLRRPAVGISRACWSLTFAFGAFLLVSYYFRLLQLESRIAISVGIMLGYLFIITGRTLFGYMVTKVFRGRITSELIIVDDLEITIPPGYRVIDTQAADLRPNVRDPMMLDRLARHLRGVDRVIIACRRETERAWSMLLKGAGISGEIIANEFDEVGAIGIGTFERRSTLVVATGPLSARNRLIKRAFDLFFAVPAIVMLLPVFILTAIAIKLDSNGPVFFRQKRVGRGNALFEVLKFRSMKVEQCDADGNVSASRDDDRITRVGRFIRATIIDELPQLLNVLFGSMSIVGPRPHALGSLAGQQLFWEVDERYWHRHALKPGITGLAQVRGFRGATLRRDDLTRRLQADLEYLVGWSVWRDMTILLSTVRVVMHKNAF